MSQKKVDQYKKEKANRKKILKREKMQRRAAAIGATIVSAAIVVWVGYSAFGYFSKQDDSAPIQTEVDLSAITEYMNGLYAGDTAAQ